MLRLKGKNGLMNSQRILFYSDYSSPVSQSSLIVRLLHQSLKTQRSPMAMLRWKILRTILGMAPMPQTIMIPLKMRRRIMLILPSRTRSAMPWRRLIPHIAKSMNFGKGLGRCCMTCMDFLLNIVRMMSSAIRPCTVPTRYGLSMSVLKGQLMFWIG